MAHRCSRRSKVETEAGSCPERREDSSGHPPCDTTTAFVRRENPARSPSAGLHDCRARVADDVGQLDNSSGGVGFLAAWVANVDQLGRMDPHGLLVRVCVDAAGQWQAQRAVLPQQGISRVDRRLHRGVAAPRTGVLGRIKASEFEKLSQLFATAAKCCGSCRKALLPLRRRSPGEELTVLQRLYS